MGSLDWPFNPLSLAIGAEATFVARSIDIDRAQMTETLRAAAAHRGSAFVEIFQNCNIYNDGAFDFVRDDKTNRIYLRDGEPIRFGADGEKGVRQRADGSVEVVDMATVDEGSLVVHDARHPEPSLAFALSRLTQTTVGATPIGIFRDVERPVYDDLMAGQLETARSQRGEGDLEALLHAGDTWRIE
jgi:2-oxoglutarate ferredoxin oxidoreductase subunit beta